MKIVRLEVENIKKLKAVRIDPAGNLIVLGGKNGAGKTSVLDAITMALKGKRSQPAKPVRDGEDKAGIVCDLGDIVIKRTITKAGGGSLVITNADGDKKSTPQAILDRLAAKLLDPLAFARMEPAKQLSTLRDLVNLDTRQLDEEKAVLYTRRTDLNRKIRDAEGNLKQLPEVPEDTPDEEIDVNALIEERDEIHRRNDKRAFARGEIKSAQEREANAASALRDAKNNLESIEVEFGDLAKEKEESSAEVSAKITTVGDTNRAVAAKWNRKKVEIDLKVMKKDSEDFSSRIKSIEKKKADETAAAKFPVEGLGFGEDGITYQELPFDQASSAEQLKVSVATSLAANPELKVLLIRDGSLLDADSMKIIGEMAEAADAQVWMERVGTDDDTAVIIEDGEIAQ